MSQTNRAREERIKAFIKEQEIIRLKKQVELEQAQKRNELIIKKRLEEKKLLLQQRKKLELQRQQAAEQRRKAFEKTEMEKIMSALKRYSEKQCRVSNRNQCKPMNMNGSEIMVSSTGPKLTKLSMFNCNKLQYPSKPIVAFGSTLSSSRDLTDSHISPHNNKKLNSKLTDQLLSKSTSQYSPPSTSSAISNCKSSSKNNLSSARASDHINSNHSNRKRPTSLNITSKAPEKATRRPSKIVPNHYDSKSGKKSICTTKSNTFIMSAPTRDERKQSVKVAPKPKNIEKFRENLTYRNSTEQLHKRRKDLPNTQHKISSKSRYHDRAGEIRAPPIRSVSYTKISSIESAASIVEGKFGVDKLVPPNTNNFDTLDDENKILDIYWALPPQPQYQICEYNSYQTDVSDEHKILICDAFHNANTIESTPEDTSNMSLFSFNSTEGISNINALETPNTVIIGERVSLIVENVYDEKNLTLTNLNHTTTISEVPIMTEEEAKAKLMLNRKKNKEMAISKSDLGIIRLDKYGGDEIMCREEQMLETERVIKVAKDGDGERSTAEVENSNIKLEEKSLLKVIKEVKQVTSMDEVYRIASQKLQQINDEARQKEEERIARKQKLNAIMARTRNETKTSKTFCPTPSTNHVPVININSACPINTRPVKIEEGIINTDDIYVSSLITRAISN